MIAHSSAELVEKRNLRSIVWTINGLTVDDIVFNDEIDPKEFEDYDDFEDKESTVTVERHLEVPHVMTDAEKPLYEKCIALLDEMAPSLTLDELKFVDANCVYKTPARAELMKRLCPDELKESVWYDNE